MGLRHTADPLGYPVRPWAGGVRAALTICLSLSRAWFVLVHWPPMSPRQIAAACCGLASGPLSAT
eukprot:3722214-Pyramimonas_sp.AAC.1